MSKLLLQHKNSSPHLTAASFPGQLMSYLMLSSHLSSHQFFGEASPHFVALCCIFLLHATSFQWFCFQFYIQKWDCMTWTHLLNLATSALKTRLSSLNVTLEWFLTHRSYLLRFPKQMNIITTVKGLKGQAQHCDQIHTLFTTEVGTEAMTLLFASQEEEYR